ncbi:MAG: preprotein translocase subunit SecG [Pseudomonadota bacterium]
MENIILIVHLIIAVFLIAVVLLQRSEGGALGMGGGGGGGGGLVSSRGAATALSKVTWGLAAAFIATSLTLTIIAASNSGSRSIIEGVTTGVPSAGEAAPVVDGFEMPNLGGPEPAAEDPTQPPAAD